MTNSPVADILIYCNPVLDLVAEVDDAWLANHGLLEGGYTEYIASVHNNIYEEILGLPNCQILAGGSGQNTARVAADFNVRVAYVGCVGASQDGIELDTYGKIMKECVEKVVQLHYDKTAEEPTATCAVCINGRTKDRSMCTRLGATSHISQDFVQNNYHLVEEARIVLASGYFVTASREIMLDLCTRVGPRMTKMMVVTLSAPFIVSAFSDDVVSWLKHAQIVAGNEAEWSKLGDVYEISNHQDISQMLALIMEKSSPFYEGQKCLAVPDKARLFICTRGSQSTICALKKRKGPPELFAVGVRPLPKELIVDTTACGDAFLGGFLYKLSVSKRKESSLISLSKSSANITLHRSHRCGFR